MGVFGEEHNGAFGLGIVYIILKLGPGQEFNKIGPLVFGLLRYKFGLIQWIGLWLVVFSDFLC